MNEIVLQARAWQDPVDPALRALRRDELLLAMRSSHKSSASIMVCAFGIALVALQWQVWWLVALWLAATQTAALHTRRLTKRIADSSGDLAKLPVHIREAIVSSLLTIVCMASGAVLIWEPGDAGNHLFVLLMLIVSATIGTVYSAPFVPIVWLCQIYVFTAIVLCFSEGSLDHDLIGLLGFAISAMLLSIGSSVRQSTREMLQLRSSEQALIAELRAANRIKGEFLANMSHELRTPLNAVIGFSDVMRQQLLGPMGTKAYVAYAQDIHASGSHLLTLIEQVLDLSKIEAGRCELRETDIDLSKVIDEAVRMISARAAEGGVELINDVPRGIVVRADETAIRQVALNIATNAVKFTPPNGTVRAYGTAMPDGTFAVAVSDTGCGIRAEDIDMVFENFGQARHDLAIREKGTGLGLPIARSLMQAHGGNATLESEPGVGTTVFLSLPRERIVRWGAEPETSAA